MWPGTRNKIKTENNEQHELWWGLGLMENMCVAAMDGMRGIHASLLSMFFCHGRTRDVEGERRKGNGGRWCLAACRWPNDHCLCWFICLNKGASLYLFVCLFVCLSVCLLCCWSGHADKRYEEREWAKGLIAQCCLCSPQTYSNPVEPRMGEKRKLRKQGEISVHRNGQLAKRTKRANKNWRRWMDVSFRC